MDLFDRSNVRDGSNTADSSILQFVSPSTKEESGVVLEEMDLLMRREVVRLKSRFKKCKAFYRWRLRAVAPSSGNGSRSLGSRSDLRYEMDPIERNAITERLAQAANLAYLDLHQKIRPLSSATVDSATGTAYMFQLCVRMQLRRAFGKIRVHSHAHFLLRSTLVKCLRACSSHFKMIQCRCFLKWVSFTDCYDRIRLESTSQKLFIEHGRLEDLVQNQKKRLHEHAESLRQKDNALISLQIGEEKNRGELQTARRLQRQTALTRWIVHRRLNCVKVAYFRWVHLVMCMTVAQRARLQGKAMMALSQVLRTQKQSMYRVYFQLWKSKAVAVHTFSIFLNKVHGANATHALTRHFRQWAFNIRTLSLSRRSRAVHRGVVSIFEQQQERVLSRAFHSWNRQCSLKLHNTMLWLNTSCSTFFTMEMALRRCEKGQTRLSFNKWKTICTV
jgi:hypothetical protein